MPPRAVGSGAISFGLVSIPVKLYTAASSESPSFNLLHAKCGNRIRQQRFCPVCNAVVERDDLIKGYEFAKDQYVKVSRRRAQGARRRSFQSDRNFRVRPPIHRRSDLLRKKLLSRPRQGR